MTKIVVAGNWRAFIHEESLSQAFEALKCDVIRFKWKGYFTSDNRLFRLYARLEYRLSFGFLISKINSDLIEVAFKNQPDLLFIYRPILISAKTLKLIKAKSPRTVIVSYNNDDPFSNRYSDYYWARHLKSIPSYDLVYAYRPSNIPQYKTAGAKIVKLLPPWFVKHRSFPIKLRQSEVIKYKSDVLLVAHFENDGRLELIKDLIEAGISVSLYGPEWNSVILQDAVMRNYYPVTYLTDDEYTKALCGSKIALAIYSSLNSDVYTRKCFEIPATRTMMIAKRTEAMLELFSEDVDCVFFDETEELIEKIKLYLRRGDLRKKIAESGYNKVVTSGHDSIGRATYILESFRSP